MPNQDSDRKLAELILYISAKCANDRKFGATKLNKILYFSDFFAYGRFESAISDAEYFKLPNGPAPRRLKPIKDALVESGDLAIQQVPFWSGKVLLKTVNLRLPDLTLFTGREIALVDEVIEMLSSDDAKSVSEKTHDMAGWNAVEMGQTIPYATILVSHDPLSRAEIAFGQALAIQLRRDQSAA